MKILHLMLFEARLTKTGRCYNLEALGAAKGLSGIFAAKFTHRCRHPWRKGFGIGEGRVSDRCASQLGAPLTNENNQVYLKPYSLRPETTKAMNSPAACTTLVFGGCPV